MFESSIYSTSSLVLSVFFFLSHSNKCAVVSQCGVSHYLYFPMAVTKEVDHCFMCLAGIHISSLVKYLFTSFVSVLIVFIPMEFWGFFIYSGYKSFLRYVICRFSLPAYGLSFQCISQQQRTFFVCWSPVYPFFSSMDCASGVISMNFFSNPKSQTFFMSSFKSCIVSCFTFRSMTPFDSIFKT